MKKFLSIALVFTMLLTGCVAAPPPDDSESAPPPGTSDNASATTDPSELEDLTLTIMGLENLSGIAEDGIITGPVADVIYEKFKITLQVNRSLQGSKTEQVALQLANNQLSDIYVVVHGDESTNNLLDSNKMLNMEEYVSDEATSNIMENFGEYFDLWKTYDPNGVMSFLALDAGVDPRVAVLGEADWGVGARHDLLKSAGLDISLDDTEEWYQSMKTLVEMYPEVDGQPAVGIGGFLKEDWGYTWGMMMPWHSGQGIYLINGGGWYDDEGNFTVLGSHEDEIMFYESAKFYNRAFREGVLDPQIFELTNVDFTEKLKTGRIYSLVSGTWHVLDAESFWLAEGGDKANQIYNWHNTKTEGYDGKTMWHYTSYVESTGRQFTMISQTNPDPDRTMQLLDFLASDEGQELIGRGVEGETFTYDDDGKYVMDPGFVDSFKNDSQRTINTTGVGFYLFANRNAFNEENDLPYYWRSDVEVLQAGYSPAMVDMLEETEQTFRGEDTRSKDYNMGYEWMAPARGVVSDETVDVWTAIQNALLFKYLPELIMAESDAEFEDAKTRCQDEVEQLGADLMKAGYEEIYNANADRVNELKVTYGVEDLTYGK